MIRRANIIKLLLFLVSGASAWGEVRVYLHQVTSVQPLGDSIQYAVLSTLDAKQYESFYGGASGRVQTQGVKSWMCPRHTGFFRDYCPDEAGRVYPRGPFPIEEIGTQP